MVYRIKSKWDAVNYIYKVCACVGGALVDSEGFDFSSIGFRTVSTQKQIHVLLRFFFSFVWIKNKKIFKTRYHYVSLLIRSLLASLICFCLLFAIILSEIEYMTQWPNGADKLTRLFDKWNDFFFSLLFLQTTNSINIQHTQNIKSDFFLSSCVSLCSLFLIFFSFDLLSRCFYAAFFLICIAFLTCNLACGFFHTFGVCVCVFWIRNMAILVDQMENLTRCNLFVGSLRKQTRFQLTQCFFCVLLLWFNGFKYYGWSRGWGWKIGTETVSKFRPIGKMDSRLSSK